MKKNVNLILVTILTTGILLSCKKNDTTIPLIPPVTYADFLKNTQWVGTLDGNGFQYRPPCALSFHADNTFTIYSIFITFPGGVTTYQDSLNGTIQKIDTLPDTRVRVSITDLATSPGGGTTKYLYITDKQKISGIDAGVTVETFQLNLFPVAATAVTGSWRGIAWKGGYAYPDMTSVIFDNSKSVTHYSKNGAAVQEAADPTSAVLGVGYVQKGVRVYFYGYNDQNPPPGYGGRIVPYFGVLLPSGDKMMIHSINSFARLPNYIYTNEPNGPNGQTPIINKY